MGERREDVLDGEWKRNRVAGRARRHGRPTLKPNSKVREHWLVFCFSSLFSPLLTRRVASRRSGF